MSRRLVILFAGSIAALLSACGPASTDGTTTVTVQVSGRDGSAPSSDAMKTVEQTLTRRLTDAGLTKVVATADGSTVRISMAGAHSTDELRPLLGSGQLRFRKVIDSTPDTRVVSPAGPSPTSAPASRAGGSVPTASPPQAASPQQAAVLAKLGAAATVAATITDPSQVDAATAQRLEPFRLLTPAEVAVLPVAMQFAVPQVTCETLNHRPLGVIDDVSAQVVACENAGSAKYLLDKARVVGSDVANATASNGGDTVGWRVDLVFTDSGATAWTNLTAEAFTNTNGACRATAPNANGGSDVCQIAIVLDNEVLAAPAIQAVLHSTSQITGGFDRQSATALAAEIRGGGIPFNLSIVSTTSR